jgi:hypothetical protein
MPTKTTQTTDDGLKSTGNGVKLLGEVIVPGASHLIDGNIRAGGLHLLGAIASVALLGGGSAGLLVSTLIRGNSFTSSTLHKPLYRALWGRDEPAGGESAAA